jgi:hypothetical protein
MTNSFDTEHLPAATRGTRRDPEKFDREQFHPIPLVPRFALNSERWSRELSRQASTGQTPARSIDARRPA